MSSLQIEFVLAALALLFLIVLNLKRSNMSVKTSILWLLLPIVFIILAIFPGPFSDFATWLGFETFSNFIFVILIALLIIIIFALTLTISNQQAKIVKLIQEVSLLNKKLNQSSKNSKTPKDSKQS